MPGVLAQAAADRIKQCIDLGRSKDKGDKLFETFAQPTDEAVGNTMKLLTVSPKFPLSSHLSAQNLLKSYYFPASLLSNQRHLYKRSRAWGSNQ
jgi:hypothetical protein